MPIERMTEKPNLDLSVIERLVFGPNAKLHPITGLPLEQGSGALPPDQQAQNHLWVIYQTQGPAAAEAIRIKLDAAARGLTIVKT